MGINGFLWSRLFLISLAVVNCQSQKDCSVDHIDPHEESCRNPNYRLVFVEKEIETGNIFMWCCKPDTDDEKSMRAKANGCQVTKCIPSGQRNPCSTGVPEERTYNGQVVTYEEVNREHCDLPDGSAGSAVYCCQKDSKETVLLSLMGAEPHEFPHMANIGGCGATIYNKDHLITAAHCIVDGRGDVVDTTGMVAKVGRNLLDVPMPENDYKIVEIIAHPGYSDLKGTPERQKGIYARIFNDIAILKVSRSITFGPNVKSLPIAPIGFNETKNAGDTVVLGWGTTDTLTSSDHLQKSNFIIRDDQACFGLWSRRSNLIEFQEQLLCIGGIMEGKYSGVAGGGDSGGPAICRDDRGQAVLCGVTSFGGSDHKCEEFDDEMHCPPSVYAEVDYFRNWIIETAGDQDKTTFLRTPVYGEKIKGSGFQHQVSISSKQNGTSCGGTLIAPDLVVTTAQCVNSNVKTPQGKKGLMVSVRFGAFGKNRTPVGRIFDVKNFKVLPGHKLIGPSENEIKNQPKRVVYSDQLFRNDLAVIKLTKKVDVSENNLPRLPHDGEVFTGPAVELASPREKTFGYEIRKRDFTILDQDECQRRMDRLRRINMDAKVGPGTLCGVEKYSGGSKCDRTLGGGLICKGEDGKDVLCGVQKFRLCDYSLPNAFENVAMASNWVQKVAGDL